MLATVVVLGSAEGPPAAADGVRPAYRPPVEAPVLDPFRLPPEPWDPGNRGIEYGTEAGTVVRAIGPGVVTFAGPVAGSLHVTVAHPDGLRSSYSFLAAIRVSTGQRVAVGDPLGVAGTSLHLGVRRGDVYLDPASLWGRPVGGGAARLVPESEPESEPGSGSVPGPSVDRGPAPPVGRWSVAVGARSLIAESVSRLAAELVERAPWAGRSTVATLVRRPTARVGLNTSARDHPTVVGAARCPAATVPGLVQPLGREKRS